MPVKQIRAFYPQISLTFLHRVAAAVSHFLREAGVEAAHFIQSAFKVAGRISQTLLATKLVSNAQAMANFFSLLFLKIRLPEMGFPFIYLDLPEGRRQKKMLNFG